MSLSFSILQAPKKNKVNVEQLIRQFLYENKSISLPGIGRLVFSGNGPLPSAAEKSENVALPDLKFTYNLQEQAEPSFIAFVAEQTGKIKPLATSDVDSFFTLAKQFVNIGKSFIIDGVGVIVKLDNGQYSFEPGTYMPVVETQSHLRKPLKVREPIPVIKRDMNLRDEPDPINKKLIAVIVGVIIIGLIIWGVYHFLSATKNGTETKPIGQTEQDTITRVDKPEIVVANKNLETKTVVPQKAPDDANDYKAVFEITSDKAKALGRLAKLRSYKIDVHLETSDSTNFKLWIPITSMPADTLHKRDSLARYFAHPVVLEKI